MSQRPPLDPLVLGDRSIPMGWPSVSLRITLAATWSKLSNETGDAPLAIQHLLSLAALGLCWEAGRSEGVQWAPLSAYGYDLLKYGENVGNGLEALSQVDGPRLISAADGYAWALITSTYPPKPAAVEEKADFSEAEPAQGSSPGSSQPTAGSAIPSDGAT